MHLKDLYLFPHGGKNTSHGALGLAELHCHDGQEVFAYAGQHLHNSQHVAMRRKKGGSAMLLQGLVSTLHVRTETLGQPLDRNLVSQNSFWYHSNLTASLNGCPVMFCHRLRAESKQIHVATGRVNNKFEKRITILMGCFQNTHPLENNSVHVLSQRSRKSTVVKAFETTFHQHEWV